ncbi:MAG: glutamine-hydrolyzing carbamoyl-phosphate synthase small subunit [Clostridiales Family XIII bacterium]|jgi:carbamoyl-phosphate synthase small subunit|nr:glutamine-hydrolyzing carbamoyl-phosphate synthase small subunit [Clostridiales Family XIII bacterium]
MEGLLVLEDGSAFRGKGFGAAATNVGELVFNTSMTGYQGILTDPSYCGQVINMTYPLIGNYGVSEVDNQSAKIHAFGFVTRDITFRPSNRMSVMSISEWLAAQGIPGVYNVDTRQVTKKIREAGTVPCVISTEGISKEEALSLLPGAGRVPALRTDYMREVGTRELLVIPPSGGEGGAALRVAVLDFGIKRNILTGLTDRGCEVYLFPYGATAEEVLAAEPDGVFLSNGPGDPEACEAGVETTRALLALSASGRIPPLPIFGICMGHQVIGLAAGGRTYKLKFGHRGANHGVIDLETDRSAITSQNHSFAVAAESVSKGGFVVTHVNLNDGTVEGMRHTELPVFSVQYHPEGSPGPNDSQGLFDRFVAMIRKGGGRDA